MRLLLSGGGTGGHVYPALAVAEQWQRLLSEAGGGDVLYVGTTGGLEENIVLRAGMAFRTVRSAALLGKSPWQALRGAWEVLRGVLEAARILRQFPPSVLLATGGYASAPVVVAAWLQRCPIMIYLPDIQPGLAVSTLSRLASKVAVSFDASLRHFPQRWNVGGTRAKLMISGYPVRTGLYGGDKRAARERLGLLPGLKTLLILGGSRGAQSINRSVAEALDEMVQVAQVIHITGEADLPLLVERRMSLPQDMRQRYRPYAYLHEEMVDALLAADLAVARAGAATMGEFSALGLPSILVPYPHAGRHQEANADYMVARGAALKIRDADLTTETLTVTVSRLLGDDGTLGAMAERARALARPQAAMTIASQLASLAGWHGSCIAGGV